MELFPKHIYQECDVPFKNIVLFVFSFDGFYFGFGNPSIFILTRPKDRYFFQGTCPWT